MVTALSDLSFMRRVVAVAALTLALLIGGGTFASKPADAHLQPWMDWYCPHEYQVYMGWMFRTHQSYPGWNLRYYNHYFSFSGSWVANDIQMHRCVYWGVPS